MNRREFLGAAAATGASAPLAAQASKTRSYNPDMEYRRLGRTGLMFSAVSMGGHWKKIPFKPGSDDFKKNRREVVAAAMECGINYIDACWSGEVLAYAEALKGRREEMYLAFDFTGARKPEMAGSVEKLKQDLDQGMKAAGLQYVDVWRITVREQTTRHAPGEIENVVAALDWAKKTGRARATGISTHHRPWIAEAVAKYPQLEVVITPYAAGSKAKPMGSMFDAFKKHDVGFIGIKPFAGGALFSAASGPEGDERARMALRHALCCDVLAASIPGLITVEQVRNAARAVKERRQFETAEAAQFDRLAAETWRTLPAHYRWLRDWEWV
jgi:aryl-alcohol dehydrogenase-like predicted oxidoreductase